MSCFEHATKSCREKCNGCIGCPCLYGGQCLFKGAAARKVIKHVDVKNAAGKKTAKFVFDALRIPLGLRPRDPSVRRICKRVCHAFVNVNGKHGRARVHFAARRDRVARWSSGLYSPPAW